MGRRKSKSSDRWLKEHVSDQHVKQSIADGYRSRAVYKLIELDEKDHLITPGCTVLELGAAPGSWTQYVVRKAGDNANVVASDILPMDAVGDVTFIQGDFTENDVAIRIEQALNIKSGNAQGTRGADLVLSDMAPNISGVASSDQARAIGLAELALEMACAVLNEQGSFVVKLFHGAGFEEYVKDVRKRFKTVKLRKPSASRARSKEVFVVASGLVL